MKRIGQQLLQLMGIFLVLLVFVVSRYLAYRHARAKQEVKSMGCSNSAHLGEGYSVGCVV